ncbi:MAG: hydrogenase maturation nickel metallochaperone HypA [Kiloniellales bacterium]|nr:hydrogenase maturation nickel metallochaperone HypA [Kiloniellales bacterium]MDJ0968763.1 hydrogenase maturation nickel metallochaperone HypA [Kiloniellales bacterium]MDJ0981455.1 hydrogenase maturation nickel metallochaperone HypA [Kiloniellales bacterium]
MHELSLTRNVVSIVAEHAKGRKVRRVRLAIGPLACVERRALTFCFELVAEGTVLAGASLDFLEAEGDTLLIKDFELEEAA